MSDLGAVDLSFELTNLQRLLMQEPLPSQKMLLPKGWRFADIMSDLPPSMECCNNSDVRVDSVLNLLVFASGTLSPDPSKGTVIMRAVIFVLKEVFLPSRLLSNAILR